MTLIAVTPETVKWDGW